MHLCELEEDNTVLIHSMQPIFFFYDSITQFNWMQITCYD